MSNVPIYDSSSARRIWFEDDIWTGPSGAGSYVPKVNDLTYGFTTGFKRCTAVDPDTDMSTFLAWNPSNLGSGAVDDDALLGTGPGKPSDRYRVYINAGASPMPMEFDACLSIKKVNADHVRVYLGTDITDTGTVISAMLDSGNHVISNNIPLEQVIGPSGPNPGQWVPESAWSTTTITDGETLTAVVYDADDNILGTYVMIAINTNFIATADTTRSYITSIEIVTSYLSESDNTLIEMPVNHPLQNAMMQCKVNYLTGGVASSVLLPIDGTRVVVRGLDAFDNTILGNTEGLVLVYNLQPNEYAYGIQPPVAGNRFLAKPYQITSIAGTGAYMVKLFVIPKYVGSAWALDYYLYDITRAAVYLVTPYVTYAGPQEFNPSSLGVRQPLKVSINLNDVVGAGYEVFQYIQTMAITINAAGSNFLATDFYTIEYSPNVFACSGTYAVSRPNLLNPLTQDLDLTLGLADVGRWLDKMYTPLQSLVAPGELVIPVPTHINVYLDGASLGQISVDDAVNMFPVLTGISATINNGSQILLEFVQKVVSTDYQLAATALNVVKRSS